MSAAPRRIVTGHDADGRSVVLSDTPVPRTLDIGTAAREPEPTDRPVRMVFVLIDGTITDELAGSSGPLQFFDQVLG
jgi:hypothetical protein